MDKVYVPHLADYFRIQKKILEMEFKITDLAEVKRNYKKEIICFLTRYLTDNILTADAMDIDTDCHDNIIISSSSNKFSKKFFEKMNMIVDGDDDYDVRYCHKKEKIIVTLKWGDKFE